ncbi:MAG: DUF4276 family protein [Verrucomicrobiota bacterium]
MRIGLIVDGQAEFRCIPKIIRRLSTPCAILDPLYADMQPLAPVAQIVRSVKGRVHILANRGVDRAVFLIDFETRATCPGSWARLLEDALRIAYEGLSISEYKVVMKTRKFENWVLGDPSAIASMSGRFNVSASDLERITPDKADHVDAAALLSKMALNKSYDKIDDAERILTKADPLNIAANSRSFRRFLRILEIKKYGNQSRRP